jgi:hypothetical protein
MEFIQFNMPISSTTGSPFNAPVFTEPDRIVVSGQSLASSAVGKTSYFKLSNVTGSVEDIEINVEGLLFSALNRTNMRFYVRIFN